MNKLLTLFLSVITFGIAMSQQDNGRREFTVFHHENGAVSSEGYLVDGKPDGYWKTFYSNGVLKSEGNRRQFELDSLWLFYDEEGRISLEINYMEGKKHGERVTYLADEVVRESFVNDIKHGATRHFNLDGKLLRIVPFENGLENGLARYFDVDGNIIELITYQRGFITGRERINRYDANNQRNGVWKWFYENDVLRTEGVYRHGMRHGIFKEYDRNGNLVNITKYVDDVIQESVAELARLEIRRDYYPTGQVKVEATFRNGIPEGVRREFNEEGEIEQSYFYRNGIVVAEGILSESGQRQGLWTEYYPDGMLRARGTYTNDQRTGEWEFYYQTGQLEQRGTFDERGLPSGKWLWYYEHGDLLRQENYVNGLLDGMMTEYDIHGNILTMGDYIEGLEEGFWFFEHGDHREEGEYSMGMLNGQWKYYYGDGSLSFEGRFIEDNPNGTHVWYYPNGRKREEGQFVMGRRNGDWVKYNDDGTILITIGYMNGIERRYDGINIPEDELIIDD